jgi:hypothetical protein
VPCISRDPSFIPPHNVSATCVCADTYVGLDCSDTIADTIIRKEQAKELENPSGCFAQASGVLAFDQDEHLTTRQLSDLRVGDRIASMDHRGHLSATNVVFIHDHLHPADTFVLHYLDSEGVSRRYELTGAHAVPTALKCHGKAPYLQFWCFSTYSICHEVTRWPTGGQCKISSMRPASEVFPGSHILHVVVPKSMTTFEVVNVTKVTRSRSMVRYVVTAHGALLVNWVLRYVCLIDEKI